MKSVLILNKKEGETPLEALDNFRSKNKKYKYEKMTYAGRLDPMASGLLLVLAGFEVHNKEKYLALDKEYEFEILFGFATDTYDILGKVIQKPHMSDMWDKITRQDLAVNELKILIGKNLKYFIGKFIQKYPIYSSKTVQGKQLFEYAREGMEVEIPEREVWVKNLKFLKLRKMSKSILLKNIEKRIKKVNIKNDFRQKEILKIWHKTLLNPARQDLAGFSVGSFRVKCSSGTYVRGIANSLGEKIGIPALAFSIKRTKIGKWR